MVDKKALKDAGKKYIKKLKTSFKNVVKGTTYVKPKAKVARNLAPVKPKKPSSSESANTKKQRQLRKLHQLKRLKITRK